MEDENVEIIRGLYADWQRGDFSAREEAFDPDVEFVIDSSVAIGSDLRSRGFSKLGPTWREYLSGWSSFRTGAIEKLQVSGDRVVVLTTLHMRGRASGIEIDELGAGAIFTFRQGKIVRLQLVRRDDALAAAGIAT